MQNSKQSEVTFTADAKLFDLFVLQKVRPYYYLELIVCSRTRIGIVTSI